jgi:hypothetical protein
LLYENEIKELKKNQAQHDGHDTCKEEETLFNEVGVLFALWSIACVQTQNFSVIFLTSSTIDLYTMINNSCFEIVRLQKQSVVVIFC